MRINDDVTAAVDTVRAYVTDISATKQKIKTVDEQITESLESFNEYTAVLAAENALAEAKAKLKAALQGDSTHNDLLENKANLQATLKDQQHILSEHLVAYFHLSGGERQIELGPNGDAREVVLTGKLGKEAKFQTNMFAGAKE